MGAVLDGTPEAENMRKECDFCGTPSVDAIRGLIFQTDGKVGICAGCVRGFAMTYNEIVMEAMQAEARASNNTRKDLN